MSVANIKNLCYTIFEESMPHQAKIYIQFYTLIGKCPKSLFSMPVEGWLQAKAWLLANNFRETSAEGEWTVVLGRTASLKLSADSQDKATFPGGTLRAMIQTKSHRPKIVLTPEELAFKAYLTPRPKPGA